MKEAGRWVPPVTMNSNPKIVGEKARTTFFLACCHSHTFPQAVPHNKFRNQRGKNLERLERLATHDTLRICNNCKHTDTHTYSYWTEPNAMFSKIPHLRCNSYPRNHLVHHFGQTVLPRISISKYIVSSI